MSDSAHSVFRRLVQGVLAGLILVAFFLPWIKGLFGDGFSGGTLCWKGLGQVLKEPAAGPLVLLLLLPLIAALHALWRIARGGGGGLWLPLLSLLAWTAVAVYVSLEYGSFLFLWRMLSGPGIPLSYFALLGLTLASLRGARSAT